MRQTFSFTFIIFILLGFGMPFKDNLRIPGYSLSHPDASIILPRILHEVSGLTYIDSTSFACVQDENGILFIYDIVKNEIKTQYTFNMDGDYEGITRVGRVIYVLRSDGTLFQISDYQSKDFKLTSFVTGIPANNNEGLCYDEDNNRLLIACKGKIDKGPEYQDRRLIYDFNLKTKKLSKEPVFDFDLNIMKQFAVENNITLPTRIKKKGQLTEMILKFRPSAICIHPITKKLYLLSATDHLLFIFRMNGDIEHIEPLDPITFNKAEGITFLENADMLITNEGQNKKPTLLRFNYKKDK